jgi:hypothetical protein
MALDAALDRFWEAADARRLGIDAVQVVADDGGHGERRRIDDIRRDVFSVSKTVTSLVPRLFVPLGIRNPQWLRCPLGFSLGAIGHQLRTSEITRIAQLLLHEGTYGGHRLVPGDYITRMTADATHTGRAEPDNRTYGLHVWLCARDGAWRMDGIYGQFGIVLPEHHACVSVTAHCQVPTTRILDCVWEHIVPALA